jgi:hypothetical protein
MRRKQLEEIGGVPSRVRRPRRFPASGGCPATERARRTARQRLLARASLSLSRRGFAASSAGQCRARWRPVIPGALRSLRVNLV